MGLDFSHGGAMWSYGSFDEFRRRLAAEIGIDLDVIEGYGDGLFALRSWMTIDDPIVPLLRHSDCEGSLCPRECAQIAPRLRQLPDHDHDKINALLLVAGMRSALLRVSGSCSADGCASQPGE